MQFPSKRLSHGINFFKSMELVGAQIRFMYLVKWKILISKQENRRVTLTFSLKKVIIY